MTIRPHDSELDKIRNRINYCMFVFIILVIHRETGGISQLGLSYQINEENTPNIRYLANYVKNTHTINSILNDFYYGNIFCSIYPLITDKIRNQNSQLGSSGSAARLGSAGPFIPHHLYVRGKTRYRVFTTLFLYLLHISNDWD